LQTAAIGPVLEPNTQIISGFESQWHYPWSEPVRTRQLATAQQQSVAQGEPTFEVITYDKWAYQWSEPVRQLQRTPWFQPFTTDTAAVPVSRVEELWHYAWSEPVRQRPGLITALQGFIALQLDPDTQITQSYESKWHYAWSEPVRVKPGLLAAQQQTQVQGPVQTPEIVTIDKWFAQWREPVRDKPGLRTNLHPFFAFQLDPSSEITQTYESRWHYAWSEPVRVRQLATAQQPFIAKPEFVTEVITPDKWIYPWSEPVRSKPGLLASLQSFLALQLDPDTQITQNYESRWHYAWSEPVRSRPYQVSLQPFFAFQLDPATEITQTYESRWHQPWSDPVRTRQLATAQQPTTVAPLTTAETVTVDKWVYPWSDPVRFRVLATAQQPPVSSWIPQEVPLESKWHQPWSEPSVKYRLRTPEYRPFTSDTATIPVSGNESLWHQPWSEPSVKFKRPAPWYQPFTTDPTTITVGRLESLWHYGWSEPVRFPQGLKYYLQQAPALAVPPFPTFQRTIPWYRPFDNPVRQRAGLGPQYQQAFAASFFIPPPTPGPAASLVIPVVSSAVTVRYQLQYQVASSLPPTVPAAPSILLTLNATEVNTDSASFGIVLYNQPVSIVVTVKEIAAIRAGAVTAKEIQTVTAGAVTTKEIPAVSGGAVSTTEESS
jgi:hypothetical protein